MTLLSLNLLSQLSRERGGWQNLHYVGAWRWYGVVAARGECGGECGGKCGGEYGGDCGDAVLVVAMAATYTYCVI